MDLENRIDQRMRGGEEIEAMVGEVAPSSPRPCTILVWFRRDLRLDDNPALAAAAEHRGSIVVPVYIWCPEEEGQFQPGRMSRWWLKQSLIKIGASLERLGAPLIVRRSRETLAALLQIAHETGASRVYYNHLYDPLSLVRDQRVKQGLLDHGFFVRTFRGDLLYEPWEITDDEGKAMTTFLSFWQKSLAMPNDPVAPVLPPRRLNRSPVDIHSCSIEDLQLENEADKGSNSLLAGTWTPGWFAADKALTSLMSGPILQYLTSRKDVKTPTSRLSPHLHFGEISVRKIFYAVRVQQLQSKNDADVQNLNMFLRSITLREYARYLSFNFPFTHKRSLLANLRHFPWRHDEGYFKTWRQGRTGYPLVDAGMRELWATGWLHCKLRSVVASFLVKFLQLPWTWGMKYFWDVLLDSDIENDVLGWQYISGGLPDGHELDRLADPKEEGYQLDPDGEYVRKWLPELSRLDTSWIHHPWDAPSRILKAAGVELGSNYPRPIVELATARSRQQEALVEMMRADAIYKGVSVEEDKELREMEKLKVQARNASVTRIKGGGGDMDSIDQKVPSTAVCSNNLGNNVNREGQDSEKTEVSSRRRRRKREETNTVPVIRTR